MHGECGVMVSDIIVNILLIFDDPIFWIVIIILIILLLLLCIAWILNKILDLGEAHSKPAKYSLIILVLVSIVAGGFKIRDLYYKRPPYRFWNELLKKNPKPFNVSQEEFEAKNRAGYCWRDRKYYSKEELWYKAMKSLTGRMIYENNLFWDNEVLDAEGKRSWTSADCERWNSCKVWRVPVTLTNQEFKAYIGDGEHYREKVDGLKNAENVQSYMYTSDKNYINDEFKLKDFILIHDNIEGTTIYGKNCCSILNKTEWSVIRKNYNLYFVKSQMGTFVEESKIPEDLNIDSWGVGNFYLSVTNFTIGDRRELPDKPNNVFYLNNCGDILYKPFYFMQ